MNSKFFRMHARVREVLNHRLNKLGHVSVAKAFQVTTDAGVPITYDVLRAHFHQIMEELVTAGRAERLEKQGQYWIYRQEKRQPERARSRSG